MAEAANQQPAPVVKQVQTKKIKIDGKKVAYYNAFAISFATFIGVAVIFNAIAGFTKGKWSFGIPFSSILLSWDISVVPNIIIFGVLALVLAIFGLTSVNKITDADALKKAWGLNKRFFGLIAAAYAINLVTIAIYSLMSIKKGAGKFQAELWLESFIPSLVMGAVAFGISSISKAIAGGKTQLVRTMSYIALSVASVAFIMMMVEQLVSIHGKKSVSDIDDLEEGLDYLKGLF